MTFRYRTIVKTQKTKKRKSKYQIDTESDHEEIEDTTDFIMPTSKVSKLKRVECKGFREISNSIEDKLSTLKYSKSFATSFKTLLWSSVNHLLSIQLSPDQEVPLDLKEQDVDIVCYGLGSVGNSVLSQWQLALILTAVQELKLCGSVYYYDPVPISKNELKYLNHQKIKVIEKNEEGRRKIVRPTIFFMPHCPLTLYDRVIEANWDLDSLSKICILGNRLANYQENTSDKRMQSKAPYIMNALQLGINIHMLEEFHECPSAFNDLAFQTFISWSTLPTLTTDDRCTDPEFVSN